MLRLRCFCSALLLTLSCGVDARSSFCAQTPDSRYLNLHYDQIGAADVNNLPPGEADSRRVREELLFFGKKLNTPSSRYWLGGVGHEYLSLQFDELPPPEPQSNGHLHTLYLPVHWVNPEQQRQTRLSVAPAIGISSNILKNPDKLHEDSLQLWLALEYKQRVTSTLQWLLGLCADHRFGHYQGYPVAGLEWQPGERWSLRLAYPDTSLSYRATPRLSLTLAAGPDGNQWQILDSDLDNRSRVVREAWLIEGQISWQLSRSVTLSISVGKAIEPQLQLSLERGAEVELDLDDSSYTALGLRWHFAAQP